MIRTLAALALLLGASSAHAAIVATCDPADPIVPGRLLSVAIRTVDAAELSDPARIVWESPARPGARDVTEWDERGQVYLALGRMPSAATDKCDAGLLVAMTAQDLAAIAAAEDAAQEAAAQATYGATGCVLVEGDAIIGRCADGTIVTSPLFQAAVEYTIKQRLAVADGEYLVRDGAQIVGSPARSRGGRAEVAGPVALNGVESALAQVLNVPIHDDKSRFRVTAKLDFVKDTGTTARVATVRVRRGDNTLIGLPCVTRSQPVASTEFGPCVIDVVDINPGTGTVSYGVTAVVGAGAGSARNITLTVQEAQ